MLLQERHPVSKEAIRKITDDVIYNYGKIDGLVNAAGIWGNSKPFFDTETSEWEKCLELRILIVFEHEEQIRGLQRKRVR